MAEAGDGAEAVQAARTTPVDLAVLDVAMPRMTGLQAELELSRRRDPPRILMLSMYDNEQYFFAALKAGASGYVLKSVADRDLVDAATRSGPASSSPEGNQRRVMPDEELNKLRISPAG